MPDFLELMDYVERRSRLAGASLLERPHPFNLEIDEAARRAASRGSKLLNFATYDYLGLTKHPRVQDAACEAVRTFGPGVNGSRLVGGERTLHRTFEREIAAFLGHEDALLTVSGYALNMSLIGHLLGSQDLLVVDELAHNSIMMGLELSRATTVTFRHNDLDHLDYVLGQRRHDHKRKLVVVEGLYSMDGDVPDLPRLINIKRRAGAWLMVDEAHSVGVLGERGRGLAEHHSCDPADIELVTGTLSKALASCGGFVCAPERVVHWLRHTLPAFVYSVGATPAAVAASLAALSVLKAEPRLVKTIQTQSKHALKAARARGLQTGRAAGFGIIPIHVPTREGAIDVSMQLLDRDIYIPPIMQQAVSQEEPRLRMFITAAHSTDDVDTALDAIAEATAQAPEEKLAADNVVVLPGRAVGAYG